MSTLRTTPQGANLPGNVAATQAEAAGDQPLPLELVDPVVADLSYQTAFYLEAVQAMVDGVTLGAEQVQDKRIEFLEVGPSTDPEAAILLFALTLVLEGTVGPAVAALATRTVMRPMMQATAKAISFQSKRDLGVMAYNIRLYRSMGRGFRSSAASGRYSPDQSGELLAMAGEVEGVAAKLRNDLRGSRADTRFIRRVLNKVTTFTQNNLVAATKGGIAVLNAPGSPQALDTGSTAGVEARAAAMASASKLRLTVAATHEALEVELRRPGITVSQASKILDEYRVGEAFDLAHIRENFQLATEAMIWAKLLLDQATIDVATDRAERAAGRDLPPNMRYRRLAEQLWTGKPSPDMAEGSFLKLDRDKKIVAYLLARFGRELERWIGENNKTIPIRDAFLLPSGPRFEGRRPGSLPQGWWDKQLSSKEREDFLVQYLVTVAQTVPELRLW